ncbi:MAG: prepilin-type N-terminal cleavage/methylation domain-containing protein [Armatimonadetes bacterium]|nr:prepilin-type N-terminal cleavage/methylation domain-containing protein [Armatimonadota bacterium]NIO74857.1 prepilin-type N-terminal cleavage/methylation domain-containing protein [Armatimonadota bacterium]NIO95619.1 prepilin-type N-terminal cleavage/methylation domain-containing protein [Armatimonadota bacterium]
MNRMLRKGNRGFTLIEMLIVIVVIAILALIVIPRLLGAGRKAKEATLKGDLHQLRNAIQQFEADMGDYPAALNQLVATTAPSGTGGTGIDLDSQGYQGPYLRTPDGGLPKDPFTAAADWTYTATTGDVHSASTLTALDGTSYSAW